MKKVFKKVMQKVSKNGIVFWRPYFRMYFCSYWASYTAPLLRELGESPISKYKVWKKVQNGPFLTFFVVFGSFLTMGSTSCHFWLTAIFDPGVKIVQNGPKWCILVYFDLRLKKTEGHFHHFGRYFVDLVILDPRSIRGVVQRPLRPLKSMLLGSKDSKP